ncbi:Uncharacterized protein HZ326_4108 [Fusarium oxysporum f. sp. albedinis]|nr:Uncharacterized protein HZ326_4108 [Fusarium oxysporum f. sp. albedinis]
MMIKISLNKLLSLGLHFDARFRNLKRTWSLATSPSRPLKSSIWGSRSSIDMRFCADDMNSSGKLCQ